MRKNRPKERKIHIALPQDVHQRLRVKCALEDLCMQEYVASLIERDVQHIKMLVKVDNPKRGNRHA